MNGPKIPSHAVSVTKIGWGTFAACAVFTVLMYGAVIVRDHVAWRSRPDSGPQPRPAAA